MKKKIINLGGIIILYSIVVLGVLLLNARFRYINEVQNKDINNYIAMNK